MELSFRGYSVPAFCSQYDRWHYHGIHLELHFSFALTKVGEVTGWGIFRTSWLTSPETAMLALILVTVWQMSGYLMVIYVAGFTNISSEMIEAAAIDGATKWQLFRFIKLPMIRSSITICTFMAISKAFMSFDVNLSLTAGGHIRAQNCWHSRFIRQLLATLSMEKVRQKQ